MLKTRIEELEKNRIDTTAENAELKARVAKLEQNFKHQLEDGNNSSENIVNDLSPVNHNISSDILYNTETINAQDSRKRKKGEALIQEISLKKDHINENLSSDQKSACITDAKASSLREISDNKNIINLYQNACNAEESAMKANQEEILCWCLYAKEFKDLVRYFMTKYNIGTDKIQYIKTYSANSISRFTNEELQKVIDYFSSNHDNSSTEISTTSGLSNHVTEIPESSSESIPTESQVSDSSSSEPSQENDQD
ncbi:18532_t:CDS:2, partial [Dentiscutata erythropus]